MIVKPSWPRLWLILFSLVSGSSCSGLPHVLVPTDPLTAEEHVKLGAIYAREALHVEAYREFNGALNQKPDFVPALIGLGNLSYEEGKHEEAEQYYLRALSVVPGHPGASNNLAVIYAEQGQNILEAERLGLKALSSNSGLEPYILHTLATVYFKQERFVEARKALDQADALISQNQVPLRDQIAKLRQELP